MMGNITAERIKKEREDRSWTQDYVAEQLGFRDSSYISKIEKGKRNVTPEEMISFAKLFNCSVHYLLGTTDNKIADISPGSTAITFDSQIGKTGYFENVYRKTINLLKDERGISDPDHILFSMIAMATLYAQAKGIPIATSAFQTFQYPNMTPDQLTKLVEDMDKILESDLEDPDFVLVEDIKKLTPQSKNAIRIMIDALKEKDEEAAVDNLINKQPIVRRGIKIKNNRIAAHRDDNPMNDLPEDALQSVEDAKLAYLNESPQQYKKK